ncbi:hypothetical protein GCM10020254_53180 [Streptomyces goshikiensis]
MPETVMVRGQRVVGSGRTSGVPAGRRGARTRTSAGVYGASRIPRRAQGGAAGEGGGVPGQRVGGGLGGVEDGREGALAVVRGAGLEQVHPGQ